MFKYTNKSRTKANFIRFCRAGVYWTKSNIRKTTVLRNFTPRETTVARGSPAPPEPGNSERPFLQPHNFRAIRLAACPFGPPQKPKPDFSHRKKIRLRPEKLFISINAFIRNQSKSSHSAAGSVAVIFTPFEPT